ncbi:hypothetical protein FFF34_001105 [Inquilinus sp. KBS0705]|nr:hypothetical protein FFF34_001105 [Inquilinus sp. KBS0705]
MNKRLVNWLIYIFNVALFYAFMALKAVIEYREYGNSYVDDVIHCSWFAFFALVQIAILYALYRFKLIIKEKRQFNTCLVTVIALFVYFAVFLPSAPSFN